MTDPAKLRELADRHSVSWPEIIRKTMAEAEDAIAEYCLEQAEVRYVRENVEALRLAGMVARKRAEALRAIASEADAQVAG